MQYTKVFPFVHRLVSSEDVRMSSIPGQDAELDRAEAAFPENAIEMDETEHPILVDFPGQPANSDPHKPACRRECGLFRDFLPAPQYYLAEVSGHAMGYNHWDANDRKCHWSEDS